MSTERMVQRRPRRQALVHADLMHIVQHEAAQARVEGDVEQRVQAVHIIGCRGCRQVAAGQLDYVRDYTLVLDEYKYTISMFACK